ncbi:MAG TPA: NAD-dependent epimerase/dehydratase family protein, partial [Bacteroidia bacterium]|nr:NAD-dependent epimerase/dehydratase family protein [Bacteroidia bacterium]
SIDKLPEQHSHAYTFIKGDVNNYRDISEIMLTYKFDYVFHLAAVVGVQRTQENPISVFNDIDGIKNILNLSKNTSVKRVFFSSSSEVYGEPVSLPQHEHTTPLNSRVPYAVVKNVGESFCKSYQQEYNLDYTIFRFFNTYGPSQSTDFVLPRFISAALKNQDITIYGDGLQTRTFTYIDDNIDTCLACLYKNEIVNDVINIGNDKIITVLDLAKNIINITKSNSKIIHLPPLKEGDMTRRQPDNKKMLQLLNRNLISLEEGIKLMLNDKHFLTSIGV